MEPVHPHVNAGDAENSPVMDGGGHVPAAFVEPAVKIKTEVQGCQRFYILHENKKVMLPVNEVFQLPPEWTVFQFHLAFQAVPLSVKIGMLWHIFDNIIMGETMMFMI